MVARDRTAPHPGRSYTSASGALVRVDYVKPDGDVLAVVWPAWWANKDIGERIRFPGGDFASLIEQHELQSVRSSP